MGLEVGAGKEKHTIEVKKQPRNQLTPNPVEGFLKSL